jgi:hypothetical protein
MTPFSLIHNLRDPSAGRKKTTITSKRRHRHSPEEIICKIQEADLIFAEGDDVAAFLRQVNVTKATFLRLRDQFGDLKV